MSSEATLSAGAHAQSRRRRAWLAIAALAGLLLALVLVSLATGAVQMSPARALSIVAARAGIELRSYRTADPVALARQETVLLAIRAPRVLGAVLIGAVLAVSGATLQGLFRNPLADPALVGVSGGAAVAVAGVIVLGGGATIWALPFGAFAGSVAATALVYALATRRRRTDVATLLLAGIAVNALAGAGNGLFIFAADDAQLRDITFWSLGSLGGLTWRSLAITGPVMAVSIVLVPRLSRQLNTLLLGERDAAHLGTNVQMVKILSVAAVAAGVGAAVSVSGIIGFVGLVAPHLVRLAIGPDYRTLVPGAAVLGASLLLLADLVARTAVAPAELPIGIVTALVGGPFFLWLLVRFRERGGVHA